MVSVEAISEDVSIMFMTSIFLLQAMQESSKTSRDGPPLLKEETVKGKGGTDLLCENFV